MLVLMLPLLLLPLLLIIRTLLVLMLRVLLLLLPLLLLLLLLPLPLPLPMLLSLFSPVPNSSQLSVHFRLPLVSLRDLMSVVRPSGLVPAELLLDAVTYHADPGKWSGDPLMVRVDQCRYFLAVVVFAVVGGVGDGDVGVAIVVGTDAVVGVGAVI